MKVEARLLSGIDFLRSSLNGFFYCVVALTTCLSILQRANADELIGTVADLHDDTVTIDILDVEQRIQIENKVRVYWTTESDRIMIAIGEVVGKTATSIVARLVEFPGGAPALGMDASILVSDLTSSQDAGSKLQNTQAKDRPAKSSKSVAVQAQTPTSTVDREVSTSVSNGLQDESKSGNSLERDELAGLNAKPVKVEAAAVVSRAVPAKPDRLTDVDNSELHSAVVAKPVIQRKTTALDAHMNVCARRLALEQAEASGQGMAMRCYIMALELAPENKAALQGLHQVDKVYRDLLDTARDAGQSDTADLYLDHLRTLSDISVLEP